MKRTAFIIFALLTITGFHSCNNRTETAEPNNDTIVAHRGIDTLLVVTIPDSALWGHMGEGTGMSVLEFITDNDDTLYLNRTSEVTGKDGVLKGDIRNYTDRFCILTTDNGESLKLAINVTQLQEVWGDKAGIEN